MKPGDLRRWLDNETPEDVLFILLERTRIPSAGGEVLDGWRILEDGIVKNIYNDVIHHYSESVNEAR
jgi:hypothetical protein